MAEVLTTYCSVQHKLYYIECSGEPTIFSAKHNAAIGR